MSSLQCIINISIMSRQIDYVLKYVLLYVVFHFILLFKLYEMMLPGGIHL